MDLPNNQNFPWRDFPKHVGCTCIGSHHPNSDCGWAQHSAGYFCSGTPKRLETGTCQLPGGAYIRANWRLRHHWPTEVTYSVALFRSHQGSQNISEQGPFLLIIIFQPHNLMVLLHCEASTSRISYWLKNGEASLAYYSSTVTFNSPSILWVVKGGQTSLLINRQHKKTQWIFRILGYP